MAIINCPECNHGVSSHADACPSCGYVINRSSKAPQTVYVENNPSGGVAAVLSFLIPGLGQIYKGQVFNGLVWFVLVIVGYVCFVVPGLLLHLFCIIGAANVQKAKA